MIPIKYNVRNLRMRWIGTLMTVFGTGLVVWSSCILFGLVQGLQHSLNVSGDPLGLRPRGIHLAMDLEARGLTKAANGPHPEPFAASHDGGQLFEQCLRLFTER